MRTGGALRLALSSFLIGGGHNDRDGKLLLHLAGALLLDYYATEGIGSTLHRRLYFKVTGLKVHEVWECHSSSLAASTTTYCWGDEPCAIWTLSSDEVKMTSTDQSQPSLKTSSGKV